MNVCCLSTLLSAAKFEKIMGVCTGFEYDVLLDAHNYRNVPHTAEREDIASQKEWVLKAAINSRPSELIGDFISHPNMTVRIVEDAHLGHRLESASIKGNVLFLEFASNCA